MRNQEILIKLSSLVEKLEENQFYKEADIIHQHFIKIAEEEIEDGIDPKDIAQKAGTAIGLGKAIGNAFKTIGKGLATKPGKFLGFGLVNELLNKGVDYSVDFFEDAQGPYNLFKNHLPDVRKIISKIKDLVNDDRLNQSMDNLLNKLENTLSELESAKYSLKTAHNINIRTVYNNSNTKLAIRGEISEAPKYLRDLIQGGAIGAGAGAFFGGIGALPGAIMGALGKTGGRAAEDIFYANISDTGKAYFQARDLNDKVTRMANSIGEIDTNKMNELKSLASDVLEIAEEINVANPDKSYLENVIRRFEKKVEKVTKPISDAAKGAGDLVEQGKSLVKENDNDTSPSTQSTYFIR